MQTWDTHTEGGQVTGFEIPNTLIWRGGVVRLLKRVPGVEITKYPKFFSLNDDDFVHFNYRGEKFFVVEPYGDNNRYWIVAESDRGCLYVPEIRERFKQHRPWAII